MEPESAVSHLNYFSDLWIERLFSNFFFSQETLFVKILSRKLIYKTEKKKNEKHQTNIRLHLGEIGVWGSTRLWPQAPERLCGAPQALWVPFPNRQVMPWRLLRGVQDDSVLPLQAQKCSYALLETEVFLNSSHLLNTYCVPSTVLYRLHNHYHVFNPDNTFYEEGNVMVLFYRWENWALYTLTLASKWLLNCLAGLCGVTHCLTQLVKCWKVTLKQNFWGGTVEKNDRDHMLIWKEG